MSERTLETTLTAISDTVKTAGELLTSSLSHRTTGHLMDELIFSKFRHGMNALASKSMSRKAQDMTCDV